MTAKARVQLPCGCVEIVDFDHGQRLVYCPGGGTTPTNGKVSQQTVCPGGRRWVVTAEPVPTMRYAVTALKASA